MSIKLTEIIIDHIYSNLVIVPSDYVNQEKSQSILSKDFLLVDRTLDFKDSKNSYHNKVWSCQATSSDQTIHLMVGDCSLDENIPEYCLIVKIDNLPTYGCYLVADEDYSSDALIACTLNGTDWMSCSTYLQATFLAGMEQLKDLFLTWKKTSNHTEQFDLMKSFLTFHSSIYKG